MKTFTYYIKHPGEDGMEGFTETVRISVESGDPGGNTGEFERQMLETLREWYDGAAISLGTFSS